MSIFKSSSFCNYKKTGLSLLAVLVIAVVYFFWIQSVDNSFASKVDSAKQTGEDKRSEIVDSINSFRPKCEGIHSGILFNKDSIFTFVEISAEPPGGMKKFSDWMKNYNLIPLEAIEEKGAVAVSFIVEKDGSLSNFNVDKKEDWGEVIVTILKQSGKWKPGILGGIPVRTRYILPIRIDATKISSTINQKGR